MLHRYERAFTTYLNPVYPKSFPDPFVLKFAGEYFAYCTGFADDGNVFPVLRSDDLVNWSEVGGAMLPQNPSPPFYWAPEVFYDNGKFYLYYSVGNETLMELRVAVSDRPDGGFADAGRKLTKEDFAIDAHVFVDDDGAKYLFYATDFLEHSHIGTGTVVDRMIDWFTLEGRPRPVTRARYDWQVYDPNRKEKGGVRWHTVEGPTVLKRKGRYYEMFSGGNWQNMSYGVSFATSDRILSEEEWLQFSDGETTLPILRTIPELVIGPGHNCVVRGPNNRELYCVYHRWTEAGRVMAIDRLDFAGDRIFVVGATHTPQPAPFSQVSNNAPSDRDGGWNSHDDAISSRAKGSSRLRLDDLSPSFLLELTWSFTEVAGHAGLFGVEFESGSEHTRLSLDSMTNSVSIVRGQNEMIVATLPAEFDWTANHLLAIEADHLQLNIKIDYLKLEDMLLDAPLGSVVLFSEDRSVRLAGMDVTHGFEELFEKKLPLDDNGWNIECDGPFEQKDAEFVASPIHGMLLRKGPGYQQVELAANFRVVDNENRRGEFGLKLFGDDDEEIFRLSIDLERHSTIAGSGSVHSLPDNFQLGQYHQLRVIKTTGNALCYVDDVLVDQVRVPDVPTSCGVFSEGVHIAIEMVRVTSI